MERELSVLEKRIKLVFWAMAFAVLSALLVCVLIGTAFLGALVAVDLSKPVAGMFVLSIGALTVCLLAFLREVFLAAMADRARSVG
jgi:uncharacterized membrane protein